MGDLADSNICENAGKQELPEKKFSILSPDFQIIKFPSPGQYRFLGNSVCAITEDMNLEMLYSAYMQGIFPWFSEEDGEPVIWHSTNPRFVLFPEDFHVSKSLKKFLKKSPYSYTMDKCFSKVIEECGLMNREGQDGTWIGEKIKKTYTEFHEAGFAHSFEVWLGEELVGGFYGVLIGSVFCGESMFTKATDSSKSAFALFMETFIDCGGKMLDSQAYTDNIARYGAKNISRTAFLRFEKEFLHKSLEKDLKAEFEKRVSVYKA